MNNIYLLILGMALVTYLPRIIPFVLIGEKKLSPKFEEFLSYIPYAALGALIFPGSFDAIPNHELVSVIGISIAFFLGYLKNGIIIPVMGAIAICIMLIKLGI